MGIHLEGKKPRAIRRLTSALLAALFLVSALGTLAPAAGAPSEQPHLGIGLTKDAYWYGADAVPKLTVAFDNQSAQALKSVLVRIRVQSAIDSRADLDTCFDSKTRKSYRITQTLERDVTLKPGVSTFEYEFPLAGDYSQGVYPFTVEAVRSGSVVATVPSEFIVTSPDTLGNNPVLKTSVVFNVIEPPHRGPDGMFRDEKLAAECDPAGENPGWFSTLTKAADRWHELRLTYSLSPLLLEEMMDACDGYVRRKGGKEERVGPSATECENVSAIVNSFQAMGKSPRFQFLSTPYTEPNLETLGDLKWYDDARHQISKGHTDLEKNLETTIGNEFYYPPGLALNSQVIAELGSDIGNLLLLSPDLLGRTREGRRLQGGDQTVSWPVKIAAGEERQVLALFADKRMDQFIRRVEQSDDVQGVVQGFLSELMQLYLEKPSQARTCVIEWPGWWRPPQSVTDELFRVLQTAPWTQSATVSESFFTVPTVSNQAVEVPVQEREPDEYFSQVGLARERLRSYSGMVFKENPELALLTQDLSIAESDVWRQWERPTTGLGYASAVLRGVDAELAKVDMPAVGSISLTGGNADIPLSVVNGTGYRVKGTLEFSSNGLGFPDGETKEVVLEPKENLFEIPVKVQKKGRVSFKARLVSNGMVLGNVDTNVLTSRFNTFAMIVVAGILGLILLVWVIRVVRRVKAGKHKRGHARTAEDGAGEQGEAPA